MLVPITETRSETVDLDAIRADLEQAVRESDAVIATLEAEEEDESAEGVAAPGDEGDDATGLSENDREEALVDAAVVRRDEALAALARLDAGTYGVCVDCGEQIAEARLEFRPEASRCLACQERFEESEG